jgi:hypothetical protein
VICTAPKEGAGCDGLLYTLKPGQNATTTLRNLLDVRLKVRDPLYESNGRLYVKLEDLLDTPQNATGGTVPMGSSVTPSSATPLF